MCLEEGDFFFLIQLLLGCPRFYINKLQEGAVLSLPVLHGDFHGDFPSPKSTLCPLVTQLAVCNFLVNDYNGPDHCRGFYPHREPSETTLLASEK